MACPSNDTFEYIQTDQVLLAGCESTPIWKQYIHSGAVPELISLELISLAEWLILFVWAVCCSEMVPGAELVHIWPEMYSQSSFYIFLWCPLWK